MTITAQLRLLLAHDWLTWQHQWPPFSIQHTIQQAAAAGTSSAPTSSATNKHCNTYLELPIRCESSPTVHARICCPNSSLRGGCQEACVCESVRLRKRASAKACVCKSVHLRKRAPPKAGAWRSQAPA